ncbi:cell division protein FtsZ [Sphingobium sp. SJ10-10]|uniref:cell division protein FtsZ n=1 Tax=unclassified Sphingobium TaxID=2611147 RepID=UPI0007701FA4|nr:MULTISPECIES: cell division protein FtsZ [unclassified Sphingobium]AMK24245.1 cell division protein FtsZ [Sphingobium sp. TKS]MEC6698032.1 cell division protein FtsZ [Sphingobium sp. SJ10-10]NML90322.1 cell division protein FtsZ [Sphingobium sp. TB-6]
MSIEISPPHVDELKPRIAVIGVGGAGGNAIANMIAASVEGVDFIVANTDAQALNASPAERRIQLGPQITEGLGAGSRPEIGKAAAEETIASVEQALDGAHMCFIAAGMGGGTGTGAAPVIAKAARDRGILTVGVVTKPFTFEGNRRMKSAESGIEELQKHVDTLIVIPNQNLFLIANPNTTFKEAFQMADEVLQQGVRGITDLMVMPGLINLDFADVRSVMGEMGKAMMGTGEAEGDGRALQAAEKAIANPLLDGVSMRGAKGVIVSIVGGDDMRLMEVDEAANHIRELVDPDANIIWGSAFNDNLNGKIRVSVVATGIDSDAGAAAAPLTQPFSFASRPAVAVPTAAASRSAPQPVPAPAPAAAPEPEPETLELDVPAAPAPAPLTPPVAEQPKPAPFTPTRPAAVFSDEDPSQDELLLGAEEAEAKPAPAPAPQAAPRVATGGTLFERMAGLTRGADKGAAASDDGAPTPDIPRFLNRQSNQ